MTAPSTDELRAALTVGGTALDHTLVDGALVVAAAGTLTGLDARLLVERSVAADNAPDVYLVVEHLGGAETERYEFAPANSPRAAAIAAIWAAALDVSRVGLDDDFLDLGGDSFAAVEIVDRMERECGLPCSAAELYQTGTIRQLLDRAEPGTAR